MSIYPKIETRLINSHVRAWLDSFYTLSRTLSISDAWHIEEIDLRVPVSLEIYFDTYVNPYGNINIWWVMTVTGLPTRYLLRFVPLSLSLSLAHCLRHIPTGRNIPNGRQARIATQEKGTQNQVEFACVCLLRVCRTKIPKYAVCCSSSVAPCYFLGR